MSGMIDISVAFSVESTPGTRVAGHVAYLVLGRGTVVPPTSSSIVGL